MQHISSEHFVRYKAIQLYDLYLAKRHCDVTLCVDGHKIRAHSCVLAAASIELDVLLHNNEDNTELVLHDFTINAFNFLVPYIYKSTLNWEDLQRQPHIYKEVLNAAQCYGFQQVGNL